MGKRRYSYNIQVLHRRIYFDTFGIKMQEFIKAEKTIANIDRDFIEWHNGKRLYAFWALEIKEAAWLQNLAKAKEHLCDFFLSGYTSTPSHKYPLGYVQNIKTLLD